MGQTETKGLFVLETLEQRVLLSGDGLLPLTAISALPGDSSSSSVQEGFDGFTVDAVTLSAVESQSDLFGGLSAQDEVVLEQTEELVGGGVTDSESENIEAVAEESSAEENVVAAVADTILDSVVGSSSSATVGDALVDQLTETLVLGRGPPAQSVGLQRFVLSAGPIVAQSGHR